LPTSGRTSRGRDFLLLLLEVLEEAAKIKSKEELDKLIPTVPEEGQQGARKGARNHCLHDCRHSRFDDSCCPRTRAPACFELFRCLRGKSMQLSAWKAVTSKKASERTQ
jgi:hypothetical protein